MSDSDKRLPCELVRDVLPLYVDEAVNEVTADLVKEHIDECDACREEYRNFMAEVPGTEEKSRTTKEKFRQMVDQQKRKHKRNILLAILISCVLVCTLEFVLTRVTIVPMHAKDLEVDRVYRIESALGDSFYLRYKIQVYEYSAWYPEISYPDDKSVRIDFCVKKPVFSRKSLDKKSSFDEFIPVNESCEKLYLGDTLVWSKEENGGDAIPEYVYEFAKVYFPDSSVTEVDYTIDEDDYVGMVYLDGRKVLWDLDGNVIFDGNKGDDENVIDEDE